MEIVFLPTPTFPFCNATCLPVKSLTTMLYLSCLDVFKKKFALLTTGFGNKAISSVPERITSFEPVHPPILTTNFKACTVSAHELIMLTAILAGTDLNLTLRLGEP